MVRSLAALGLALGVAPLAACGSTPGTPAVQDADVTADGATTSPDAPACGVRAGMRGKTARTVTAAGLDRTYHVYLPDGDPQTPMPLVFVHHGYTMSGQLMFDITGFAQLADTEKLAIAFPDGQGGPLSSGAPWNVGSGLCPSTVGAPPSATGDDFAMLDAIEADVALDQCLDRDHIFVTGFSMGGYFSHHAGCMRSGVRGVAPHSGGTHDLSSCVAGPTPILIMHGTGDTLIPAGCADPAALPVVGVTPSADAWAAHNGCAPTTTSRAVQGGTCVHYEGCPTGGQVELCTFTAMGHCWAGGAASAGIYACPLYESATDLAWQFWKTYAW